eukprot:CAMPEP_0178413262 /NCGR_PEP_ID=MMETSP0689_2-20121128/22438_1 /TAXON_ID=160604 /ORGANISM="Amphidinium massartii, Strain CS-259" /LENGTH=155 /DNA_ID=CAMNT_0020034531 /DNA_START=193 /DNA_END=657 /DNA_ORIENTATION=+
MNNSTLVLSPSSASSRFTIGDLSLGLGPPTYHVTCRPPFLNVFAKLPPVALIQRKTAFRHSTQPAYLLKRGGPSGWAASAPVLFIANCSTPFLPKWGQGCPTLRRNLARSALTSRAKGPAAGLPKLRAASVLLLAVLTPEALAEELLLPLLPFAM